MPRAQAMRVRALAKINRSLRILGIHADGYHELRTTFQSIALHDTLTFTPSAGPLSLSSDDPGCPGDRTNLVWRAAERIWRAGRRRGTPQGVAIHIEKRIPMQAGLGGGSSDAAAALRALNRFWRFDLPDDRLHQIAVELGADVAYFLVGGTALGAGRGEILFPLDDHSPAVVVMVRPDFGVSTRDAYQWWDAAHGPGLAAPARQWAWDRGEWGNDLEPPVVARHPEIGQIVKRLTRLGAVEAAMSGSGSAVFGLFSRQSAALTAADGLMRPGRLVTLTHTVSRRDYVRLTRLG